MMKWPRPTLETFQARKQFFLILNTRKVRWNRWASHSRSLRPRLTRSAGFARRVRK